jgi:hypothetical protein
MTTNRPDPPSTQAPDVTRLPLLDLWREKQRSGRVFHDPDLLVLHRASDPCGRAGWGTTYYSRAREEYKAGLVRDGLPGQGGFDVELMARLTIGRAGGLVIAANPNSLFPGHLVLFPEEKRPELAPGDLDDLFALAAGHPSWSFIHNMADAAASIVDWVHFQAYPVELPLQREVTRPLARRGHLRLSLTAEGCPTYALAAEAEGRDREALSTWAFALVEALADGLGAGEGQKIPCNLIASGGKVWVIPRSRSQTRHAATYLGALEMGGIFCLPSADSFRSYLPDALAAELRSATLAGDPAARERFESSAVRLLSGARP